MCGIFAWFDGNSRLSLSEKQQRANLAVKALIHRGPDSQTLWHDEQGRVFLGHTRLGITGEQGAQPLWSSDKHVGALVNGEFYDFKALKEACQKQGYTFQTDTDSELLIALYLQHGRKALDFLHGEFAFVLWDKRQQQIWAVRDRTGIKPLRYFEGMEGVMFASEIHAMQAWGLSLQWDDTALTEAFALQYPRPDRTLYQGVLQVEPGESIVWQQTDGQRRWKRIEQRRYWAWYSESSLPFQSTQDVFEAVEEALTQAIQRRIQTHWPIAIHLSGGLDSSSLLALTAEHHHAVTAFGVGFENVGGLVSHDESLIAAETANHLGVEFVRVDGSQGDIIGDWIKAVSHAQSIAINGHIVAKWRLNQAIHERGFRVAMTGEGADEALLGYPFFKLDGQAMGLWEESSQHVLQHNAVSRGLMLPDENGLSLAAVLRQWRRIPTWLQAKASLGLKLQDLLKDSKLNDASMMDWAKDPIEPYPFNHRTLLQGAAATWATRALGGYILPTLGDAMEGAFGIEGRLPFLDTAFLEVAMRIPPHLTRLQGREKGPLRMLLQKRGLETLASRPKHPFQAPPLWSQLSLRTQLIERWSDGDFYRRLPMLNPTKLDQMMQNLNQGDLALQQAYEPVIGFLLSLDALSLQMRKQD